jgi:flagellar FliL protein
MAEEEMEEGADEEGGAEEAAPKSGKKKLLIIVALVLLLVLGGLAAAYFTGLLKPVIDQLLGAPPAAETVDGETPGGGTFFELPELLVNLNTGGRKTTFLKIKVSIELENPEAIPQVEAVMPRVLDNFQVYLRELRLDDLRGSAGMYRLREELLVRVNAAVAPIKVRDVLFNEMLVQ